MIEDIIVAIALCIKHRSFRYWKFYFNAKSTTEAMVGFGSEPE